jgi:hypothetical protein
MGGLRLIEWRLLVSAESFECGLGSLSVPCLALQGQAYALEADVLPAAECFVRLVPGSDWQTEVDDLFSDFFELDASFSGPFCDHLFDFGVSVDADKPSRSRHQSPSRDRRTAAHDGTYGRCGHRDGVKAVRLIIRSVLSSAAGIVTFLGTMTAGCDDVDGVPSWERCRSWFGTPIIEWLGANWSPILPLFLGIGVGYLTWWLLGFTPLRAST